MLVLAGSARESGIRRPYNRRDLPHRPFMNSPALQPVVSELIELLSLERLEDNLFRGQSRDIGTKYVFGGQVLGQALSAAQANLTPPPDARPEARRAGNEGVRTCK